MHITYLGHAGFCVETQECIIVMDPWLSPTGAFDSAWFQFPRNHHLAAFVQEKLQNSAKQRFLYISHEHKDHFDIAFLNSLQCRDFTLILPQFRRTELIDALCTYHCIDMIKCQDGQSVHIPGGSITLYLDDSEMDRDSSILVRADGQVFLNINDCKLHDRLASIVQQHGPVDVFTAQFSGAVWHPTCYDYPRKVYEAISKRKMTSKFESVARAITTLNPRVYLTSAGPACFLDPTLFHLNFEKVNIFPRATRFLDYLQKRLKQSPTHMYEPMPGDVLDVASGEMAFLSQERINEQNYESHIHQYAALYEGYFEDRKQRSSLSDIPTVYNRLQTALEEKLDLLVLRDRVQIPLYFRLSDAPDPMLRVDFPAKVVERVSVISDTDHYCITAPSWEVARVLDGKLTWEDFTLTFRMRLNRAPDVYHVVIHGFLMMEPEDMNWFCSKVLDAEANQERILVEADGRRCSIHRYCPHQGADLSQGWIEQGHLLTCPRHRWQFDLDNEGRCTSNDTSIRAFPIEEN